MNSALDLRSLVSSFAFRLLVPTVFVVIVCAGLGDLLDSVLLK